MLEAGPPRKIERPHRQLPSRGGHHRGGGHLRSPCPIDEQRGCSWERWRLDGVVAAPRPTSGSHPRIAQQHEKKNEGIWRQCGGPLQHLVKRKVVVVGELDPVRERPGLLLDGLPPAYVRGTWHPGRNRYFWSRARLSVCLREARNAYSCPTKAAFFSHAPGGRNRRLPATARIGVPGNRRS